MAAVIQWLNCLTKGSCPVSSLKDLEDGKKFAELARILNPTQIEGIDDLSVEKRYEAIKAAIEGYFHVDCTKIIDFQGLLQGQESEVIKLGILLLSGVVDEYIYDEGMLLPLYQLEVGIQETVKEYLQAALCNSGEALCTQVSSIRISEEMPSTSTPRRTSGSGSGRKRHTKKKAVVESPLRLFIESPLRNKAEVRKEFRRVSNLSRRLASKEQEVIELQSTTHTLKAEINSKDELIKELSKKTQKSQPVVEEKEPEKKESIEKLNKKICALENQFKEEQKKSNELVSENSFLRVRVNNLTSKVSENQVTIEKRSKSLDEARMKIKELNLQLTNSKFKADLYEKSFAEELSKKHKISVKEEVGDSKESGDGRRSKRSSSEVKLQHMSSLKKELTESEKKLKKTQNELDFVTAQYASCIDQMNLLESRSNESHANLENKERELEIVNTELASLRNQLSGRKSSESELFNRNKQLEQEVARANFEKMEKENESQKLQAEFVQLRKEKDALFQEITDLKNKIQDTEQKESQNLKDKFSKKLETVQLEIGNYQAELVQLRSEKGALSQEITDLKSKIQEESQNLNDEFSSKLKAMQLEIDNYKKTVGELNSENQRLTVTVSEIDGYIKTIEELNFKNQRLERAESEIDDFKKRIDELNCENRRLEMAQLEANNYKKRIGELNSENENLKAAQLEVDNYRKTIDDLNSENQNLEIKLESYVAQCSDMETEKDKLNLEILQLSEGKAVLCQEIQDLKVALKENEDALEKAQQIINENKLEIDQRDREIVILKEDFKKASEGLMEIQNSCLEKENNLALIISAKEGEISEIKKELTSTMKQLESEKKKYEESLNEIEYTGQLLNDARRKEAEITNKYNASLKSMRESSRLLSAQNLQSVESLTRENNEFKSKCQELSKQKEKIILERQQCESELCEVKKLLDERSVEKQKADAELTDYRERFAIKESEVEKLQSDLDKLFSSHSEHFSSCDGDCRKDELQLQNLKNEKESLLEKIEELDQALKAETEMKHILEEDLNQLQQLKTSHSKHFLTCSGDCDEVERHKNTEINELNKTKQDLSEELNNMKIDIEKVKALVAEQSLLIEEKEQKLDEFRKDNERYQDTVKSLTSELAHESGCAKEFQSQLMEERKKLQEEIQRYHRRLEEQEETLSLRIEALEAELIAERARFTEFENMAEADRMKQQELQQQQSNLSAKTEYLNLKLEKKKELLTQLEEALKNSERDLQNFRGENERLSSEIAMKNAEFDELRDQFQKIQQDHEKLRGSTSTEIADLQTAVDERDSIIESLRKEVNDLTSQVTEKCNELEKSCSQLEKIQQDHEKLRDSTSTEIADLQTAVDERDSIIESLRKEVNDLTSQVTEKCNELEKSCSQLEKALSERDDFRDSLSARIEALQGQLTQMHSRNEELEGENREKITEIQKLEAEKNNLSERINSLESELKEKTELETQHLKMIEESKKSAEFLQRQLNERDSLLKHKEEMLEAKSSELAAKMVEISNLSAQLEENERDWKVVKESLSAKIDALQVQLHEMQTQNAILQNQGEENAAKLQRLETEKSNLCQRITYLESCLEEKTKPEELQVMDIHENQDVKNLTSEIAAKTEEINRLSDELAEVQQECNNLKQSLSAKEEATQNTLQKVHTRSVECQCQIKNEVAEMQGQNKSQEEVKNLQEQEDKKSDIINGLNAEIFAKDDRIERLIAQVERFRRVLRTTYEQYKLLKKKLQFSVKEKEKDEEKFKSISAKFKSTKKVLTKLRIAKASYEKATKQEILKLKRDVAGYESAKQEIEKLKNDVDNYERAKRLITKLQTEIANCRKLKSEMSQLQASLEEAKEKRKYSEQEVEKSETKYRKLKIQFDDNAAKLVSLKDKLSCAENNRLEKIQEYAHLLNRHFQASRDLREMEDMRKSLEQKSQLLDDATAKIKKLQRSVENYKRNRRHEIVYTNDQLKPDEVRGKTKKRRRVLEETTYTVDTDDAYMIPIRTRIVEEIEESDDEEPIIGVLTQHDLNELERLEAKSEREREERKKRKKVPKPSEEEQIIAYVNKTVKEYEESLKKKDEDDDSESDEENLSFFRLKPKKKKLNLRDPCLGSWLINPYCRQPITYRKFWRMRKRWLATPKPKFKPLPLWYDKNNPIFNKLPDDPAYKEFKFDFSG